MFKILRKFDSKIDISRKLTLRFTIAYLRGFEPGFNIEQHDELDKALIKYFVSEEKASIRISNKQINLEDYIPDFEYSFSRKIKLTIILDDIDDKKDQIGLDFKSHSKIKFPVLNKNISLFFNSDEKVFKDNKGFFEEGIFISLKPDIDKKRINDIISIPD